MEKVELKNNTSGLEVYINGVPDIDLIPQELKDSFIDCLTEKVLEFVQKKNLKMK